MATALTGKVPVPNFYKARLEDNWWFRELTDYLRQFGVLDESSSWHGPRVTTTNYSHKPKSCTFTTESYNVCCSLLSRHVRCDHAAH